MSLRDRFEPLSADMISELEQLLELPLREAYAQMGPGQAFIQFIRNPIIAGESVPFLTPERLWLCQKGFKVVAYPPESTPEPPIGLTRWVALNDKTVVYPTDGESEHYVKVHSEVRTEIVGPIHCNGKVTGVVLFDRTTEDRPYGEVERQLFKELVQRIDHETLRLARLKEEPYVADELQAIASHCYSETITARGYIAIKRWDGTLEYFPVGEGRELFLDLAPHEGLCGKVLRTGVLENPKQSLLDEANYIPSDNRIKSEIVCPIKVGEETIGVINLESYLANAYDDQAENFLQTQAQKAADFAKFYTKPPDSEFGYAIADLFGSSLWVRPPESSRDLDEEVLSTLGRWSLNLLHSTKYEYWKDPSDKAPDLMSGIPWHQAVQGGSVPGRNGSTRILYAPLLVSGDPVAVIALKCEREEVPEEHRILKALCRIASEAFRRAKYEYRVRCFIRILKLLVSDECGENEITEVVKAIPFLLQSDHCTLFYRLAFGESVLFAAGPSTAEEIHLRGYNPGYVPSVSFGLTGFVAATGRPLRIKDVRDREELNRIDPGVAWRSLVSEEIEYECRSYLAYPIFDSLNPSTVVGVLRTHRDDRSHRSGFTEEDFGMFKTVSFLLGRPLSAFVKKSTC